VVYSIIITVLVIYVWNCQLAVSEERWRRGRKTR